MPDKQKAFLQLYYVEKKSYKEIEEVLKITRKHVQELYAKSKIDGKEIAYINKLWSRKKIILTFPDFFKWYTKNERKCHYCQITEDEIKQLIELGRLNTKRLKTRGKKLELERKEPEKDYNEIENLVFSCYWCNNAKTDTFSEDEFKKVGKVFREIWDNKLGI